MPVTLLLIHGVGDAPDEKSRSASETLLNAQLGEQHQNQVFWYNWNEAIERSEPADQDYLQAIAHGTRVSARLEFPPQDERGGLRTILWRLAMATGMLQLSMMAFFLLSCLWVGVAWAAGILNEGPSPLDLGMRLGYVLFPPLDPVLLKDSLAAAREMVFATALMVFVVVPTFQVVLAAASGVVAFRVALRCAILEVSRPVLALLTTPPQVLLFLASLGIALLVGLAIFSRPVQVVDMEGAAITYGKGVGIFILPFALLGLALVVGLTSYLLRSFLKVVSDIVQYLGASPYRERIHADLRKKLTKLDQGSVVIVAHSLGSVIAVDSLLAYPKSWSRFSHVHLLTCGSPLRRLLHRFFPDTYPTPERLASLLHATYSNFSWHNAYRPLDYVGSCLGDGQAIAETRFRQNRHLHIGYWNDPQLIQIVAEQLRAASGTPRSESVPVNSSGLSLDRFRHGPLVGEPWFIFLMLVFLLAGFILLLTTQMVLVPRLELEHLANWERRLENEGRTIQGSLCPQRELDISDEVVTYERAVAGVSYKTRDGQQWVLEAYADSRPDINWDQVQRAVFGREPDSLLIAALRVFFWQSDPLLEIKECQQVPLRYLESDPRIFSLPLNFHTKPEVGFLARAGRVFLLMVFWLFWWFMVFFLMCAVLGVPQPFRDRPRKL
jgi:hypothetical protein